MKNEKSIIIVGGTADERTKEAHRQAVVTGYSYVVTCWDAFVLNTSFAAVLEMKPELVVVEGVPAFLSVKDSALIKQRVSGDTFTYRPLFSREVFIDWSPSFIFIVKDTSPIKSNEDLALQRRFDVVDISKLESVGCSRHEELEQVVYWLSAVRADLEHISEETLIRKLAEEHVESLQAALENLKKADECACRVLTGENR